MRISPGLISPFIGNPSILFLHPPPLFLPPFFHAGIAVQNFFIPPWRPIRSHLPLAKPLHLSSGKRFSLSLFFFLFFLSEQIGIISSNVKIYRCIKKERENLQKYTSYFFYSSMFNVKGILIFSEILWIISAYLKITDRYSIKMRWFQRHQPLPASASPNLLSLPDHGDIHRQEV